MLASLAGRALPRVFRESRHSSHSAPDEDEGRAEVVHDEIGRQTKDSHAIKPHELGVAPRVALYLSCVEVVFAVDLDD